MSVRTSSSGRSQFCDENAYSVSAREADLARGAHHVAHGVGALAVALHARQAAQLGPAAVAVHDDGDVAWQLFCGPEIASPACSITRSDSTRPLTAVPTRR